MIHQKTLLFVSSPFEEGQHLCRIPLKYNFWADIVPLHMDNQMTVEYSNIMQQIDYVMNTLKSHLETRVF